MDSKEQKILYCGRLFTVTSSSFHGKAMVTLVTPLELELELTKFSFFVLGAHTVTMHYVGPRRTQHSLLQLKIHFNQTNI